MFFLPCCAPANEPCEDVDLVDSVPVLLQPACLPTLLTSGHRTTPGCAQVQKAKESCQSIGKEVPILGRSTKVHDDKSAGECLVLAAEHLSDFVASTADKRKCLQVSENTGLRTEAEYCADTKLGQLMVKTIGRLGHQEMVAFPIASITDIYTIDDGEECFPAPLMNSLSTEEKAGLFLIEYALDHGAGSEHADICLVEASRSARDELLQCLLQFANDVERA